MLLIRLIVSGLSYKLLHFYVQFPDNTGLQVYVQSRAGYIQHFLRDIWIIVLGATIKMCCTILPNKA